MSEAYTPTTDDMMRYFVAPSYKIARQQEGEEFSAYLSRISIETAYSQAASERAARRWLRAHDAEITAMAKEAKA